MSKQIVTFRLDSEVVEALDEDAERLGYGTRADLLRYLVHHRCDILDADSLSVRVDALESRVATLERRVEEFAE